MSITTETLRDIPIANPPRDANPWRCALPITPPRPRNPNLTPERARAIALVGRLWANGTVLHYYFYQDGPWAAADPAQIQVVREAFETWKAVGIGLEFKEVDSPSEAEVRIGFLGGDGSWSYVGTYVLNIGPAERTMNFGWDLTGPDGMDTALHEIGHTLGLAHEHQNPNSGIVWDEDAVYTALAGPPNHWPKETTYHNIIRKLDLAEVTGSLWDPDSVMHYPFGPGLIRQPAGYDVGVTPAGGLSARDEAWVRKFYPPLDPVNFPSLRPGHSRTIAAANAEQCDFTITPESTRKYNIRTFGTCDTLATIFEEDGGDLRFLAADDDGGEDRNAQLVVKLLKGRRYVLRVRTQYTDGSSEPTVMMW